MKPYKSNTEKENCSPVSSNCVIWQGPDLPCLSLCKGDTVSDVVYKVASELCEIQAATDISDVDFSCLLTLCTASPEPEFTLAAILQLIIDKVCCSFDDLVIVTNDLTSRTSNLYEEPILPLPACLQYIDPATGLTVTELVLSQYVTHLAQQYCSLALTVTLHTGQIDNLDSRVTVLENAPCCYIPPTVTPNCTYGAVTSGVPADMDIMLESLDEQFCNLVATLGSNTQLSNAAAEQCTALNSAPALSQPGTMSGIPGWNNVVSTFAQSMQNLWITVCDLRAAMYSLKECCAPDCSSFLFNYYPVLDEKREVLTLYFDSYGTVIPAGFTNCPTLSTITVTDGVGHTYSNTSWDFTANLTSYTISNLVVDYDLDPTQPYTITITACLVNGDTTCSKTVVQTMSVPTTTTTTSTTTTSTTTTTTLAP